MRWIPLLQTQRDLLDVPRGSARFRQYLRTMLDETGGLKLPLAGFNPMSKPHVAQLLDELLALDAERVGTQAARVASLLLGNVEVQAGLVLADDAEGGWTNRFLFEARQSFETRYEQRVGLLPILLWSSDPASCELVAQAAKAAIVRYAWVATYGNAWTLRQRLVQEAVVAYGAGIRLPCLPAEEAEIIARHLDSDHYPTVIATLYGDAAARSCGYDPLGLPPQAGLRFGLHRLNAAENVARLQTLRRAR